MAPMQILGLGPTSGRFGRWVARLFGWSPSRLDAFTGEMSEKLGDDLVLEDDTDDLHSAATAGTHHRIDLVYPSNKTCPGSSPG